MSVRRRRSLRDCQSCVVRYVPVVLPVALLVSGILAVFIRWWAIPVTAIAWAALIAAVGDANFIESLVLAAANAVVGCLLGLGVRKLVLQASESKRGSPRRPPARLT